MRWATTRALASQRLRVEGGMRVLAAAADLASAWASPLAKASGTYAWSAWWPWHL